MDTRGCPLACCIRTILAASMASPVVFVPVAMAQVVGPGTITAPVNVGSGTTTLVGNTTVDVRSGTSTPSTANATNVTAGGTLNVDTSAGPSPGAIVLYTDSGHALYANGGTIGVPYGVNIVTRNGSAAFANGSGSTIQLAGGTVSVLNRGFAAAAIGGSIDISATSFNDPLLSGGTALGNGAAVDGGGVINFLGGNRLYTSGFTNAVGLGASGANSAINVSGSLPITMSGLGSLGVYLYRGGQLNATAPISLTFNGASSVGMTVDGTTMAAPIPGLSMTFNSTSGTAGSGLVVINSGSAAADTLTVGGAGAALGVWVQGSSATLTGASVITINATNNSQLWRLSTSSLVTSPIFGTVNASSYRAGLLNQGGQISSTGTTINANAAGSYGAYAGAHGSVASLTTMANNTVTASGARSWGLMAYANGQYTVTDSTVASNGGYGALYLWGYANPSNNQVTTFPSVMNFTNTQVSGTGGAYGLYAVNQTKGLQDSVSFTGGGLSSDSFAIEATGPLLVTATQGAKISGDAGLVDAFAISSGTGEATKVDIFASAGSELSGLAQADSASQANITLTDHSSWIGEAFYATNVTVDATSSWTITASSVLSGQLSNSGLVQFTAPVNDVFKSLYVHDYVSDPGTLGINTYLGDDGSPTDRLIIDGGTTRGNGLIAVANVGGPGALTSANGIPVVEVANGGTTTGDAFALSGAVVAGPYEYTLQRGGVSPGTEDYWFLRSTRSCEGSTSPECPPPPPPPPPPPDPPPPPAPPPPAPPPDPNNPPAPPPEPEAPPPVPAPVEPETPATPSIPNYRPEVSLYTALPGMALRYGWATLGNLHERVGEEEQLRDRSDFSSGNTFNALWVRVIGEDGDVTGASQGIYDGGPKYDYNIEAFQAGLDVYAEQHDNQQRDHAGLYLGTGRIRSDVTNYDGTNAGRDVVKGQSLGLYWTHFWTEGQYLDAVWQGTWSKSSAQSMEGLALHHSGFGWAASLEGGYPFHDESQVWEPQAQVIYQRFNDGQSSDAAATVRFDDIDSLAARLGLRWADTWKLEPAANGSPRLFTGWLRFNVWKEFKGQPTTSFSSEDGFVPFEGSIKGSWWQLNAGMTWELDKNTSFYANLGYQRGFGSKDFDAWDGKLGFRWNW